MTDTVVLADVQDNKLRDSTREVVTAAIALGSAPTLIVAGTEPEAAANDAARITGVNRVLALTADCFSNYDSASWTDAIAAVAPEGHLLTSATPQGKELAARLAARRDCSIVQDVISISDGNVTHPVFSGKAHETLALGGSAVITVRSNVFSAAATDGSAAVSSVNASSDVKTAIREMIAKASERLDVTEADIIISGGRGMGDPANFSHIERVASVLGAAVGASRAAVDTWDEIPHSMQVGQTGKTVNPNLYIAVGISGAIQHLAGMRTSKYIVAINKDGTAPIFKHADYGIVSTWEEALPLLESELGALLS